VEQLNTRAETAVLVLLVQFQAHLLLMQAVAAAGRKMAQAAREVQAVLAVVAMEVKRLLVLRGVQIPEAVAEVVMFLLQAAQVVRAL
jgi:hypothetical protein